MPQKNSKKLKNSFWSRHKVFCLISVGLVAATMLLYLTAVFARIGFNRQQAKLEPFYETAGLPPEGALGEVVRQEPLSAKVSGGSGYRVLYRSQRADGSKTFSSGLVFTPDAAATNRPVVAWAHGTLGMGDQCAPSRNSKPLSKIGLSQMLQRGWVVTATDYAGFGTPGVQGYLVGKAESNDVLNSVRAARNLKQAAAGSQFVVWGHSQGGNSALFSANQTAGYAPELQLMGTVASAPAAELVTLLNEQYGGVADWVIGPLITTSWPAANPGLQPGQILSKAGSNNYQKIANQCIGSATIGGLVRNVLRQKFFDVNPVNLPAWREMAQAQSAPLLSGAQPLLVVESKNDKVVLPNTTALYISSACAAGSSLNTIWLDKANHQDIPAKSSSDVINWIGQRFGGQTNASSCFQPLPVSPA